jgi:L-fucose mutarotase
MGHGDEIAIVDANFPATSHSTRCHRLDGSTATDVLTAVLSVMPLDSYVQAPALTMQVVGHADTMPDIVHEFQRIVDATADTPARITPVERFGFYDRAKAAFAIVQTGETRLYGNIILKKGVISR